MLRFSFPAMFLTEDRGAFTVRFVDLSEAITSGQNREDALVQASDCLDEAIAGRMVDGLELPTPSKVKRGQVLVHPSAAMAAKASLYLAMKEAGLSRKQLARKLGVDEKEVRRLMDPRHPSKLPRIEAALKTLGKRLLVAVESEAA